MKRLNAMRMLGFVAAAGVTSMPALAKTATVAPNTLPQKDSANFTYKYEMNILPTLDDQGGAPGPDWTSGGSAPFSAQIVIDQGNTALEFITNPADPGSAEFNNADTGALINYTTGYTIEMRARFLANAFVDRRLSLVAVPGSPHNDALGWLSPGSTSIGFADTGNPGSGPYMGANADNESSYVTLRYVQEANSNEFSVWRNGVLLGVNIASPSRPGDLVGDTTVGGVNDVLPANTVLDKIAFGKEGGNWGGTTEIDYIRFDTTGAYRPLAVPEPASLSVLSIGSVLLLRRRRR